MSVAAWQAAWHGVGRRRVLRPRSLIEPKPALLPTARGRGRDRADERARERLHWAGREVAWLIGGDKTL